MDITSIKFIRAHILVLFPLLTVLEFRLDWFTFGRTKLQQLVEVRYNFANNYLTVVPPADSDLRRCHMYLYASVPDFIL
jgi:hypothetical protein